MSTTPARSRPASRLHAGPRTGRSFEERIVSCLPAATFEMETLCRLASIESSREVDTAAVTCERRPRLLVNPDFVARHCPRDEHLFVLVMHELHHVLLGHTGLFPRLTPEHNIAFDAIVNAGLAREFPSPETLEFLCAVNSPDAFPALLLRPPEGWPDTPDYAYRAGPRGTIPVLRRLYPPPWGRPANPGDLPMYEEVLDLLRRADRDGCHRLRVGRGDENGARPDGPVLLGDHRPPSEAGDPMGDPLFADVVRRIVARWPPPPFPRAGRDAGGRVATWERVLERCGAGPRAAFARVLRSVLGPARARSRATRRAVVPCDGGRGVLPDARDRTAHALRRLGRPVTLWRQATEAPVRAPDRPSVAHVYLDVSGSMTPVLDLLLDLLRPYAAAGRARVWQFSTTVEPLSARDLVAGRVRTTYGTGIDPVLEHVLGARDVRRVLLLTDGYVGSPRPGLVERLRERGVALHVVLPDESSWTRDLEPHARSMTILPPLPAEARTRRNAP